MRDDKHEGREKVVRDISEYSHKEKKDWRISFL